ncbi:MAG: DUF3800 domain-containing protein [Lachnospiraceae bacterium]|nr:DUF3800 domain-containing protein [Lachnospiraceae bacterium]
MIKLTEPAKREERYLIFDESGNLGSSGRYFVIACIDTNNYKSLHNIMHKKLGLAKKIFPPLSLLHSNEIKAKDAYPCIKYHILECIAKKDLSISYIVADLNHVNPSLLKDKNILYNYLMKLLIERLFTEKDNGFVINIICDKHTTKVASGNSFSDYIKLFLLYERELNVQLNIKDMDSNDKNAYIVQAADYIANALYGYYEYGDGIYYNCFKHKLNTKLLFPWKHFGA